MRQRAKPANVSVYAIRRVRHVVRYTPVRLNVNLLARRLASRRARMNARFSVKQHVSGDVRTHVSWVHVS